MARRQHRTEPTGESSAEQAIDRAVDQAVEQVVEQAADRAVDPRPSLGRDTPLGRALAVVGARWALLVVQTLLPGPCRFRDLAERLPGISTNLLVERLRGLEAAGVVERSVTEPPRSLVTYELTELGHALRPAVVALSAWGELIDQVRTNDPFVQ